MGALTGLKVIEMSAIGPVPYAGMLLADMGAEVIVVDKANDKSPFAWGEKDILRRGKKSVTMNLKDPQCVELTKQLIDSADIVIEGYRPKVMERLGLGPDVFTESNPGLIYGRMTGWGQTGPLADSAGHDINYIAITGALHAFGRRDETPSAPLNLVGDYGGGSMFLIMGVLAALHERHQSGVGQVIDAAITDGTVSLMTMFFSMHHMGQNSTARGANLLDSAAHFYDVYETADGKYISVGSLEPQFYALLTEKAGLDKADFGDQMNIKKWPEMKQKITEIFKTKTRDEWCALMESTDVCFAPVIDYMEAAEHPQNAARQAHVELNGKLQPAPAPRFSRTQSSAAPASPPPGADSESVLADVGVDTATIAELKEKGIF